MEGHNSRRTWDSLFDPRFSRGVSMRDPPTAPYARSPKVVSVPVRFVSSDRRRSHAALTIQKVFRAFVVRKSVKKIAAVRREVNEVERTLSRPETAERLRRDDKDRLRLNETLMSLLLRLDSVRGVDSGVRDCRKAVIRKAIALQERIDAIASSSSAAANDDSEVSELDDSESKEPETDSVQVGTKVEEAATESEVEPMPDSTDLQKHGNESEAPKSGADPESFLEAKEDKEDDEEEENEEMEIAKPKEDLDRNKTEAPKSGGDSESFLEAKEDIEEEEENEEMEIAKPAEAEAPKSRGDSESEYESSSEEAKGRDGGGRSEVMERMLEDNEKLMGMMAELYERSTAQTQLLSSLSHRVEQLERAFLCDKLRKKKKQRRGCEATSGKKKRY